MKTLCLVSLNLLLLLFILYHPQKADALVSLNFYDQVNSFQGNNGYIWETIPTDQSQLLENIFIPTLSLKWKFLTIKGGVGIYSPLQNSEIKFDYYPYAQLNLKFQEVQINLGILNANHNYPAPILDNVTFFAGRTRLIDRQEIAVNHGFFEQGLQLRADYPNYSGEIYFNFQTHRLKEQKSVFDYGTTQAIYVNNIPLYLSARNWQSFSLATNTENIFNFIATVGFRNDYFNSLILFSYYRYENDNPIITSIRGEGLYLDYYYYTGDWIIQPQIWITSQFFWKTHQIISLEGDPFFRAPLYLGFNIYKLFKLTRSSQIKIILVNGGYLPTTDSEFYWKMIRYDQIVKFEWEYRLPL